MCTKRCLFVVFFVVFLIKMLEHCVLPGWLSLSEFIPLLTNSVPEMKCISWLNSTTVDEAQRERRLSVSAACRLQNMCPVQENFLAVHLQNQHLFLVDDRYKAIYCYIPKTGCTMWKIKLVSLHTANGSSPFHDVAVNNVLNGRNSYGLHRLDTYSYQDRVHRLKTYYKYTIVRHPLVRLVSIYRQAFFTAKEFIKLIPDILTQVRPNWTMEQVNKNNKMDNYNFTFTEFLNYTFTFADRDFKLNSHWNKMVDLCSPCRVCYDYISKLETFENDGHHLLSTVCNSTNTCLAVTQHNRNTSRAITIKYFKEVPNALRRKVIQNYYDDMNMFGYRYEEFL